MRKSAITAAAIAAAVGVLPAATAQGGTSAASQHGASVSQDVHAAVLAGVARAQAEGAVVLATGPIGYETQQDSA